MTEFFDFNPKLVELAEKAEALCKPAFERIDRICEHNSQKVLSAFINNKVSESMLHGTTGYGYGDMGRDALDAVYASALGGEDALVRHLFVNGTHTLAVSLFGVLRPGDRIVMCCGAPYDTLEEIIGKRGKKGSGSLIDLGVEYEEVDLLPNGMPDLERISERTKGAKVAYIQRSRGYSTRPSYRICEIAKIVEAARKYNPEVIVMVDNCYGEFVEENEPLAVGADLIMGSLIKNPGGGIATTGGYIAGRKDLVEKCAERLTCIGMGKEVGCSLHQNREMFLGFFLAPQTVANAVKTSEFACTLLGLLGFETLPKAGEERADIIASILLENPERLCSFVRGIQKGAPVDAFATPEPDAMPGYESAVIMAAGTFTMGSSIELSADAPLREPYAAWLQGGITYYTGKIGIMAAVQTMINEGTLEI